jgi:hypothetical protein
MKSDKGDSAASGFFSWQNSLPFSQGGRISGTSDEKHAKTKVAF